MEYKNIKKEDRQNLILLEIEKNKKINKECLAYELGVSTKTILRDIKELINKGHKIQRIKGRNGGYSLNKKD